MRDRHYVIGLDFGTLSGRAVLVDTEDGTIAATSVKEYSHGIMQNQLPDGTPVETDWCLQHPDDYLDVLQTTIPALFTQSGVPQEKVIGLSIDSTASTLLPLTRDAKPLCKLPEYRSRPHAYVKLWKHHAAQPQADEINEKLRQFPNRVARYYGERISPEIPLPKALQILHEDPELYQAMDTLSEVADWLNRLLTGEQKRSINTAGYKAMYFNAHGYPSPDFFSKLHPQLADFATHKLAGGICHMAEPFGVLTGGWARRLGLPEGIAVGCSIIDAHAGMAGSGISRPGRMMLALGTSSVQSILSHKPYSGNGIIGTLRDCVIPGYYMWESGLAAVGDQLAWFAGQCGTSMEDPLDTLTQRAGALQPGQSGLLALDWWNGNKTPYVDGRLTGVLTGLRLDTTPEEIFRALMESTAFGTKVILDLFEQAGETVEEIIACGGIVDKNPLLMQIYADVLGREIKVAGCHQTMALGAAIYAAVAAGARTGGYDSLHEAVARMTRLEETRYLPNMAHHQIYQTLYREYQELSAIFGEMAASPLRTLQELKETANRHNS